MLKQLLHRLLHSTSHSHKRRYSSSDRYYERERELKRHSSSDGYKNSHNGHRYYKDKRRHYSSS
ncbi:hypothetical protein [Paenibacillus polymyxa]|uniref:hypothetical protein n=1 Tax=Paenibacillus polymyxa TaxID=1406 RepID=UPI00202566D6|nr:hypothetical protein [Paenibacillus polymyxa]URJ60796.1 hypothetical protein MF622_000451 [Paenibacillus polymyxa]